MNPDKPHLICRKPFEWLELTAHKGKPAYVCCAGWLPLSIGPSAQDDGTAIADIEALWSSDNARKIRHSVLDGSFKYCSKMHCPHLNELSGPVEYVDQSEYERLLKLASDDSPLEDFSPKVLNCAYDRACNLACPSCRSDLVASTAEARAQNNAYIENILAAYGHQLSEISITGSGDPFGSRHFWDLLSGDILKQYPNINIMLHTNAQMLTEKRWNKIAHLHDRIKVLEISVDAATESTYAVNRYPGEWSVLMENMAFIRELKKQKKLPFLKVDFVVQSNNWREMKHFVRLGRSWYADTIYFSPLNDWQTFSNKEYAQRAVHRSHHKDHEQFREFLCDPLFYGKDIELGFLSKLNDVQPLILR